MYLGLLEWKTNDHGLRIHIYVEEVSNSTPWIKYFIMWIKEILNSTLFQTYFIMKIKQIFNSAPCCGLAATWADVVTTTKVQTLLAMLLPWVGFSGCGYWYWCSLWTINEKIMSFSNKMQERGACVVYQVYHWSEKWVPILKNKIFSPSCYRNMANIQSFAYNNFWI